MWTYRLTAENKSSLQRRDNSGLEPTYYGQGIKFSAPGLLFHSHTASIIYKNEINADGETRSATVCNFNAVNNLQGRFRLTAEVVDVKNTNLKIIPRHSDLYLWKDFGPQMQNVFCLVSFIPCAIDICRNNKKMDNLQKTPTAIVLGVNVFKKCRTRMKMLVEVFNVKERGCEVLSQAFKFNITGHEDNSYHLLWKRPGPLLIQCFSGGKNQFVDPLRSIFLIFVKIDTCILYCDPSTNTHDFEH